MPRGMACTVRASGLVANATALPVNVSTWRSHCNITVPPPHVLMVPKTGSRSLIALGKCPSYRHSHSQGRIHLHKTTYMPCTLATLREPCERVVSIFRHLKERYPKERTNDKYCMFHETTPACSKHWLHKADNVSAFVSLLEAHWSQLLHHCMTDMISSRRHILVAMPQHIWIGKYSRVTCTSELTAQMPNLVEEFGGCPRDNGTHPCACKAEVANAFANESRKGSVKDATAQTQRGIAGDKIELEETMVFDWAARRYPFKQMRPEQLAISPSVCEQTRALYQQDAQLWKTLCGTSRSPDHTVE